MFKLLKMENARLNVPEPEYQEAKVGEAIEMGETLILSAGKLTKCSGSTAPTHMAMGAKAAADTDRRIPACRIESNQIYEVPVTAAPTSLVPGAKVTIYTDGLQVTATTTDGVATVVDTNDAKVIGDKIIVRF
jgi:hypothetical protein